MPKQYGDKKSAKGKAKKKAPASKDRKAGGRSKTDTTDGKPLYKPFKSSKKGKKFSVYVKSESGGKKLIHYGDSSMQDFRQHRDPKRRASFLARAKGIKKKDGSFAYKDKNSPNYWAVKHLWKG